MEDSSIGGSGPPPLRDPIAPPDRAGAGHGHSHGHGHGHGHGHDTAPAICRICRGEGTATEPLFYPCKCSGSIKFVHQDCLMEWLSHSQKKYCELCKTSFRFTKLYAPDMPQSLPVHIFVEHMAKYLVRHLLVWLRAVVAISVWIFWLPYFMRAVWSFMFWISDEGLGSTSVLGRQASAAGAAASAALSSALLDTGTCPTTPLLAAPTTSVAEAKAVMMGQVANPDISDYLVRILRGSFGMPSAFGSAGAGAGAANQPSSLASNASPDSPASMLSNVSLFQSITRSPTLNRAIVAVLEGQAITVLIIVSFILVILVRDYVVQQQPEINMRAAFVAPENDLPNPDRGNDPLQQQQQQQQQQHHQHQHQHQHHQQQQQDGLLHDTDDTASDDEAPDHGSPLRERPQSMRAAEEEEHLLEELGFEGLTAQEELSDALMDPFETAAAEPSSQTHATDANANADADGNPAGDRASVIDFRRIYRRADGNLEEILRIMEEEGLQEKLSYWVDLIRRSLNDQENRRAMLTGTDLDSSEARERGKGRVEDSASRDLLHPEDLSDQPPRPRAVSDGPQVQHSVNPLANNTWTFAGLGGPREPSTSRGEGSASAGEYDIPLSELDAPRVSGYDGEDMASLGDENVGSILSRVTDENALADDPTRHPMVAEDDGEWDEETMALPVEEDQVDGTGDEDEDEDEDENEDENENEDEDEDGDEDSEHVDDMDGEEEVANEDEGDADGDAGGDGDGDGEGGGPGANGAFDAEAIEDMEDFEGVMELIGMRGPIAGLFQNAIFCAVLVSVTIFVCIFVPYNIGRVALWILARPMRLVRMLFELSKLTQDAAVLLGGLSSWFALNIVDMFTRFLGGSLAEQVVSARKMSWALWTNAGSRVWDCVFIDFPMTASEIQNFSATSHDALNTVRENIVHVLGLVDGAMLTLSREGVAGLSAGAAAVLGSLSETTAGVSAWLVNPSAWVINFGGVEERPAVSAELAHWSSFDRFLAISTGYVSLCMLSALYLQRDGPFSRGTVMHAWEVGIIDTLQQASGILKVILIISIEMLVFPLYCGLLLDSALLPLFEGATFKSRVLFTYNYPMTSVFVHWFVGTGYMFHFALFVSMCRKIMRPGVLYFIRDPDDPEFHPVRDVLERNLTTQLRKILFSAFVYGALVIVCLGGVVWGLALAVPGLLPIHYSSNEPVLEFPVDLLFYNFLMPLAVKLLKPSDALHTMYTWWFRKCARFLRLTSFLFGERRIDEEGTLKLRRPSGSGPRSMASSLSPRELLLEVDGRTNTVVPKTWRDVFEGGDAKPNPPTSRKERRTLRRNKQHLVRSRQMVASGRFVRAPASDRVKIPPGQMVFLPVDERGRREDGQADGGVYATDQYQLVYIPSSFRARIFVFIVSIWVFAAVTGVGLTMVPLVFGRRVFKALIPGHIRTNDIYAFSIGIFMLGTAAYSALHVRSMAVRAGRWLAQARRDVADGEAAAGRAAAACAAAGKVAYAYAFLLVVFPLLASTVVELYVTIPLRTYMYPPTALSTTTTTTLQQQEGVAPGDRHTVRVIQSWTLGLLYLKLGSRVLTSAFPESRAAHAVRTMMRRGWLRPDVKLLTRAFVSPGLAMAAFAILAPPAVANMAMHHRGGGRTATTATTTSATATTAEEAAAAAEAVRVVIMYRQSYPAAALAAILARNVVTLVNALDHWTAGVRDEAYLIGERLHNFGAGAGVRKGRRIWGGRHRL